MRRWHHIPLLALLAWGWWTTTAKASHADDSDIRVVARLYRDFAWEAIAADPGSPAAAWGTPLAELPRASLADYFDKPLVDAIAADADCVRRHSGEICHLDFDLLLASQDPGATDLSIRRIAPGRVAVSYVYPGNRQRVHLTFLTTRTATGARVKDIVYDDQGNTSLLGLLSRPMP